VARHGGQASGEQDGIRAAPPVLRVVYTMRPALTRWANLIRRLRRL